jgi:hypothetical protein
MVSLLHLSYQKEDGGLNLPTITSTIDAMSAWWGARLANFATIPIDRQPAWAASWLHKSEQLSAHLLAQPNPVGYAHLPLCLFPPDVNMEQFSLVHNFQPLQAEAFKLIRQVIVKRVIPSPGDVLNLASAPGYPFTLIAEKHTPTIYFANRLVLPPPLVTNAKNEHDEMRRLGLSTEVKVAPIVRVDAFGRRHEIGAPSSWELAPISQLWVRRNSHMNHAANLHNTLGIQAQAVFFKRYKTAKFIYHALAGVRLKPIRLAFAKKELDRDPHPLPTAKQRTMEQSINWQDVWKINASLKCHQQARSHHWKTAYSCLPLGRNGAHRFPCRFCSDELKDAAPDELEMQQRPTHPPMLPRPPPEEHTTHAIWDCPRATPLLEGASEYWATLTGSQINWDFNSLYTLKPTNCEPALRTFAANYIALTSWNIWITRNRYHFDQKVTTKDAFMDSMAREVQNLLNSVNLKSIISGVHPPAKFIPALQILEARGFTSHKF